MKIQFKIGLLGVAIALCLLSACKNSSHNPENSDTNGEGPTTQQQQNTDTTGTTAEGSTQQSQGRASTGSPTQADTTNTGKK